MREEVLIKNIIDGTSISSNIFSVAVSILSIVALWMVYAKANEPGWAALIPFYKDYVLYKISGKKKLFWAFLSVSLVMVVLYFMLIVCIFVFLGDDFLNGYYDDAAVGSLAIFIISIFAILGCSIALLVFRILQCIGLAKQFGLSGGYAVGLILIPIVFYCIIAFNNEIRYVGDGSYMGMNGYAPNGQNPYMYSPQNYVQNPYGNPAQNYNQNPYESNAQGYASNPYENSTQNYTPNPWERNDEQ